MPRSTKFVRRRSAALLIPCLFLLTLAACAHVESPADKPGQGSSSQTRPDDAIAMELRTTKTPKREAEASEESEEVSAADIENYTIGQVIRMEEPNTQSLYDNSRYDFPITMNSRVEGWIDYFTGRGRTHMERYLARSSRYIPRMKEILKKQGLPEDLVYLALIESGFNLKAKSRARAVGPWQFIKATGKRYGLAVNAWIDERRDPLKSTEAAARYLKDLYLMFESWYLAASAYNAGEYKILRAIEELKTNNYWRICETQFLRRETKDYIPKLIAAAIIAKNPARYGFDEVQYQEPLEFDTVPATVPVSLPEIAKLIDTNSEDLHELNPHLVRQMVPPGSVGFELRVPPGSGVLVEQAIAKLQPQLKSNEIPRQHVVVSGDTLRSVARRYRISVRQLANNNNLSPKEKILPGTPLLIPGPGRIASTRASQPVQSGDFITHVVRPGESLWSISEKYDVTVQDLFRWNQLHRSRIHPGKRLRVKSRGDGDDTDQANESHLRRTRRRTRG